MKCKKCGANRTKKKCNICILLSDGIAEGAHISCTSKWPRTSRAIAVKPNEVAFANERYRKNGVNVVFDEKGTAHVPDRGAWRDALKFEGMSDNNAFGRV